MSKHNLNQDGTKADLQQQRLADFFKVELPSTEDVFRAKKKTKHGADWVRKIISVQPAPFTNDDFNHRSLSQHLESRLPRRENPHS